MDGLSVNSTLILVFRDRHISVTIVAIARACHIIIAALFVSHRVATAAQNCLCSVFGVVVQLSLRSVAGDTSCY